MCSSTFSNLCLGLFSLYVFLLLSSVSVAFLSSSFSFYLSLSLPLSETTARSIYLLRSSLDQAPVTLNSDLFCVAKQNFLIPSKFQSVRIVLCSNQFYSDNSFFHDDCKEVAMDQALGPTYNFRIFFDFFDFLIGIKLMVGQSECFKQA